MNEDPSRDFKNRFIRPKNLEKQKIIPLQKDFTHNDYDLSKAHNYHLVKVFFKNISCVTYYFICQGILSHHKQF